MMIKLMRRVRARGEEGFAMVAVIAIGSVLTILAVAGVAYTVGSLNKAGNDQDYNAALAAAYAGVEEYQSLLANDPSYIRYGNAASSHTSYVDPAKPAEVSNVITPPTANPAFGLGTAGTWASVPGSNGEAKYRYEVNNAKYYSEGTVTLRATGKVGNSTRSIVADLKQSGFVDYVWFTDLETSDPYNEASVCARHFWDVPGRPYNTGTCSDIHFRNGDTFTGDVHSNDRMLIDCGVVIEGVVTTAYNPATGNKYLGSGCTPTFLKGAPQYSGYIDIPPTNTEMKKETRTDLPTEVPNPGCLYTGPTSITFTDDGYMTVISPYTKKTQVAGSPATSGTEANTLCGAKGTGSGQLGNAGGAKVKVPANNLVYVQSVPSTTTDPNYTATTTSVTALGTCKGSDAFNAVGYPATGEQVPAAINSVPSYGCRNGDVFVKGTLSGQVTVASENYAYIVNDIVYKNDQTDVLGLVGQNAIYIYAPVKKNSNGTYTCIVVCDEDREVDAALLSVAHTITVQNYTLSVGGHTFGDLKITGSIAQKYRGIVIQNSGYLKDYKYDKRFKYTAPPKFLTPASTTYGVSTWVEINAVFKASGAYS